MPKIHQTVDIHAAPEPGSLRFTKAVGQALRRPGKHAAEGLVDRSLPSWSCVGSPPRRGAPPTSPWWSPPAVSRSRSCPRVLHRLPPSNLSASRVVPCLPWSLPFMNRRAGVSPAFPIRGTATVALNPHRPSVGTVKAAKMAAHRCENRRYIAPGSWSQSAIREPWSLSSNSGNTRPGPQHPRFPLAGRHPSRLTRACTWHHGSRKW